MKGLCDSLTNRVHKFTLQTCAGGADVGRRNTERRYEEGLGNVTTPELMDLAKTRNAVDVQLHEFITAMFCNRLRVLGLINHSLVVEELVAFKSLGGM